MKNFKLTDETIKVGNSILYRIECIRDFQYAKKGDKGGFIEKESNLLDNAWVSDNALVFDNARVSGSTLVFDNARICDNARVSGSTLISGDAYITH
jgi:UDP-3-O-[3-hydroxymyristoyl] glucosamine N-acyltransferase